MMVLAVTGMPGSGKGEVSRLLGRDATTVAMGDIVREYTERKGLAAENVGTVADAERRLYGMDVWALRTIERVPAGPSGLAIIDGLRGNDETGAFRREFGGSFRVVAVVAGRPVRHARMDARGRNDDEGTGRGHASRDEREMSWGIGEAIASADHVIENEGTLEELAAKAAALLGELRPLGR